MYVHTYIYVSKKNIVKLICIYEFISLIYYVIRRYVVYRPYCFLTNPYMSPTARGYLWVTIPKNPKVEYIINTMGTRVHVR